MVLLLHYPESFACVVSGFSTVSLTGLGGLVRHQGLWFVVFLLAMLMLLTKSAISLGAWYPIAGLA
jgi:hypothetical protein